MRPQLAGLLAGATVVLAVAATPAAASQSTPALASPTAPVSHADVAGVHRGATVRQQTASQLGSFRASHANLLGQRAAAVSPRDTIHPAQGTAFINEGNDQGAFADQSVTPAVHPPDSGTTIYTPTMYPAGGSCVEVTTVYTVNTQAVEAWDWCNHIDFEASVNIDSAFLSKYGNGGGIYSVEIVQTNSGNNTWTAYLYDYASSSWDTFYSSSGSTQAGTTGWDVNELYSNVASNGQSYACADMAGQTFSASGIQVDLGGTWTAAAPSNSNTEFDQPAANFDCPAMSYQMVHQYDHWQVYD